MERLTRKFGDKIILPMIPMEIKTSDDLENYHKVRKDIEDKIIRLAEYEDTELTPEEIQILIADFESLNRQQGEIIKEVHKLREESDFWKHEAIKAKAQLGEIRILVEKQ